jgi:transposase
MTEYIGIDLHKAKSFVTRMDGYGQLVEQVNLSHATGALQQSLRTLPADVRLAVEATGNWMWWYEQIEDGHPDVVLAHPLKTRAIASARIKTDKIDATTWAHLLRTDLLPAAYLPPRTIRDQRERLRYRASLVRLRTQVKTKRAAILSKTGGGRRPRPRSGGRVGSSWRPCPCALVIGWPSLAICASWPTSRPRFRGPTA